MPEEIAYHTDEHVPTAVITGLRARGVDVVTSQESGLLAAQMSSIWPTRPMKGGSSSHKTLISCVFMLRGLATLALSMPSSRPPLGTSSEASY